MAFELPMGEPGDPDRTECRSREDTGIVTSYDARRPMSGSN